MICLLFFGNNFFLQKIRTIIANINNPHESMKGPICLIDPLSPPVEKNKYATESAEIIPKVINVIIDFLLNFIPESSYINSHHTPIRPRIPNIPNINKNSKNNLWKLVDTSVI